MEPRINQDPATGPGTAWTCASCGSARPAGDPFCGSCGAPAVPAATSAPTGQASASRDDAARKSALSPAMRTAVLGALLLVTVAVAAVVGGGQNPGPAAITTQPDPWRCDGSERAWVSAIPASASELVVELHAGDADGAVVVATPVSRDALVQFRQLDGTYRVTTSDTAAPECSQPAGRYGLVIRDTATGTAVAKGELTLEP